MDTKQKALKEISEFVALAHVNLAEAERIADEHGVSFRFDGPEYGMGGYYRPIVEGEPEFNGWGVRNQGWVASSQEGC